MTLSWLDGVMIGLFLAAILALGFSARIQKNSVLQFLAAGRALTLPVFVATLVSTWYGGILGVGESVSYFGVGTWVLLGVPYYVFALLYAWVLARRVRGAEQISLPERLRSAFGPGVGLVGAVLVFLLALPAAHVLMLGVLTEMITGWSLATSVIVATLVGPPFLFKGGLLADARVSVLAFLMMYLGFAVMVIFCLTQFPVGETWGRIENRTLMQWDGGAGWIAVASFFILGAWTLVDPGFHQRVASAASPEVGRKGVFVAVGFWVLFDLMSITTGLYALALLKAPPEQPLMIFPMLGDQVLPAGLKAIFLCGMVGTILSAMVGYALVSGATLGREIVGQLRASSDDAQITRFTRIGIAVACALAIVLSLQIPSVVNLWYQWGGAVIGALLGPVLMSYGVGGPARTPRPWILASMLVSFVLSLSWLVAGYRSGNTMLEIAWTQEPFRIWIPPVPDGLEVSRLSLGTLAPGLVASALVLGLGRFVGDRKGRIQGR